MRRVFLLFMVIVCSVSFASAQQVDNYKQDTVTLYQRVKGFSTDPMRSKWRQVLKKEGDLFVLTLYDKKDVLQERISFIDKELLVRKGAYAFFKKGMISEEGNYEKGYKMGKWNRYYSNKQLSETLNYTWDRITGHRKLFYKDGKLALDEMYSESGKLETGKYFDEQGQAVDLAYVVKALQ